GGWLGLVGEGGFLHGGAPHVKASPPARSSTPPAVLAGAGADRPRDRRRGTPGRSEAARRVERRSYRPHTSFDAAIRLADALKGSAANSAPGVADAHVRAHLRSATRANAPMDSPGPPLLDLDSIGGIMSAIIGE